MNKEISETIISYITESKLNGAIFINGQWSTGKTYYFQNELMPLISKEIKNGKFMGPIYVFLYGIEKLLDISKRSIQ